MLIKELVESLSFSPFDPIINFKVGEEYQKINQTASAISFYLRAAEYGYDKDRNTTYNSLLKASICFESQGHRRINAGTLIMQAIAYDPTRPEGYFLLSRGYERAKSWMESHTYSEIGLLIANRDGRDTPNFSLDYPGKYGLEFQKAISVWWLGREKESIDIFEDLLKRDILPVYRTCIEDLLSKIKK